MHVLVTDLVGNPGAHREDDVSLDVAVAMDAARIDTPITGTVRFDAGIRDIVATGRLRYTATLICVRCLSSFDEEGRATFRQLYSPAVDTEDVLPLLDDGTIDLETPVRDEVVLSLPLTPVCRPDCAGICATCGTDLNSEPCEGHEDTTSSPFAILAELLDPEDS